MPTGPAHSVKLVNDQHGRLYPGKVVQAEDRGIGKPPLLAKVARRSRGKLTVKPKRKVGYSAFFEKRCQLKQDSALAKTRSPMNNDNRRGVVVPQGFEDCRCLRSRNQLSSSQLTRERFAKNTPKFTYSRDISVVTGQVSQPETSRLEMPCDVVGSKGLSEIITSEVSQH
jgi:hypothetical protein